MPIKLNRIYSSKSMTNKGNANLKRPISTSCEAPNPENAYIRKNKIASANTHRVHRLSDKNEKTITKKAIMTITQPKAMPTSSALCPFFPSHTKPQKYEAKGGLFKPFCFMVVAQITTKTYRQNEFLRYPSKMMYDFILFNILFVIYGKNAIIYA